MLALPPETKKVNVLFFMFCISLSSRFSINRRKQTFLNENKKIDIFR